MIFGAFKNNISKPLKSANIYVWIKRVCIFFILVLIKVSDGSNHSDFKFWSSSVTQAFITLQGTYFSGFKFDQYGHGIVYLMLPLGPPNSIAQQEVFPLSAHEWNNNSCVPGFTMISPDSISFLVTFLQQFPTRSPEQTPGSKTQNSLKQCITKYQILNIKQNTIKQIQIERILDKYNLIFIYIQPKHYTIKIYMNTNQNISTVVGIDIGSFTTKLAAVQRGTIDIITNQANFRQTPSVVGYGDGQRKIGQLGNVKLKSNFKNTVVSPTRYLGLNASSEAAQKQLQNCPCHTKLQGQIINFKVNVNGVDQSFSAEQILASFMTQLSFIIQHNNFDDKLVMFSIPAYMTQIQKKAFLNAAQISGFKNAKLVDEVLAMGMDYGSFKKADFAEGKNIIFVDFGHSKLTASLIRFTDTTMEVLYEKYNRNLGCRDIDKKIFQFIASKFEQKKGLNIRESKRACLKLIEAIQKQRKILSGINQTQISIECLFEDEDLNEPISRDIMFEIAGGVFSQISNVLMNFKEQIAKLGLKFDSIELVGGGSRIPKFVELVEKVFQMAPSRTTNSSQTIATGATLAAVQQSGLFRFHTFNVTNRSAVEFVASWKPTEGEMIEEQFPALNNKLLLKFNDVIPCEKSLKLSTTKKSEILISYDILEEQIEKKVVIVKCQAPMEGKNEININFKIDGNGFISLDSVKDNDGQNVKFELTQLNVLSEEKVKQFKAKQREMFVKDFSITKSHQKKNQLQSFIYKQKQVLSKPQFLKYLSSEQRQAFEKYLGGLTEQLEQSDSQLSIRDYDNKKLQIEKQVKKMEEITKKRKQEILLHIKQLDKLKAYAVDIVKQIQQRYRNSKPVADTCLGIKQIHDWAEQQISQIKKKNWSQISFNTSKQIQEQYNAVKELVNMLVNPQKYKPQQAQQQPKVNPKPQQQPQQQPPRQQPKPQPKFEEQQEQEEAPRHVHYQTHYDPQQRLRQQQYRQQYYQDPEQQMRRRYRQQNPYHQPPLYQQPRTFYQQPQPQQRRRQQQQNYDPFGMSRSGFFGPTNNFFGNMGGFW